MKIWRSFVWTILWKTCQVWAINVRLRKDPVLNGCCFNGDRWENGMLDQEGAMKESKNGSLSWSLRMVYIPFRQCNLCVAPTWQSIHWIAKTKDDKNGMSPGPSDRSWCFRVFFSFLDYKLTICVICVRRYIKINSTQYDVAWNSFTLDSCLDLRGSVLDMAELGEGVWPQNMHGTWVIANGWVQGSFIPSTWFLSNKGHGDASCHMMFYFLNLFETLYSTFQKNYHQFSCH